jgi:spermidine/putrescine transport system permease protein
MSTTTPVGRVRSLVASLGERVGRRWLLLAPLLAFEGIFFVGALLYLLRVSLYESAQSVAFVPGTWTLSNYAGLLGDSFLQSRVVYSLGLGATVTAITLVLGFVYAYAAWRSTGWKRLLLLGAVLVELLISIVIKVYAWLPILSPEGLVNDALVGLGLVGEPLGLVNNEVGVVVGLVYSMFPYVVLAVYAVVATVDWQVVEAARDLGAGRVRSVVAVVLPQAMPGLVAGGITAFAWSTVAYAAPTVLGSPAQRTVANEAGRFVTTTFDWPRAAALGVEAMVLVVLVVAVVVGLARRFGPAGATEGIL